MDYVNSVSICMMLLLYLALQLWMLQCNQLAASIMLLFSSILSMNHRGQPVASQNMWQSQLECILMALRLANGQSMQAMSLSRWLD